MKENSNAIIDATVEGALGVARRELFALVAALQQHDRTEAADASSRARFAIAYAIQLASRFPSGLRRLRERISVIQKTVQACLPQGMENELAPDPFLKALHKEKLVGIQANNSLLVALNLDDLPLDGLSVCKSRLSRVSAHRAKLDLIVAEAASVSHSSFRAASLQLGEFSDVVFEDCDLSEVKFSGSIWRRAVVKNCNLSGAVFFHADLSDSRFVNCDFRNADLQGFPDTPTGGATFIGCDLRRSGWHQRNLSHVSFIDCKLYGIFGHVVESDGAIFERPCLSPNGDGTQIGSKQDVIARWRACS